MYQEFYPQDGGESQLVLKLRHYHRMYTRSSQYFAPFSKAIQEDTHAVLIEIKLWIGV